MQPHILQAVGGRVGGAGTPDGERVVVRLDGDLLTLFTETGTHLFHTALLTAVDVEPHPGVTGLGLGVRAPRHGVWVPVRFTPDQLTVLQAIVSRVRATIAASTSWSAA